MTDHRIRPRRADVRQGILRAARREFIERGYSRSSLQKIAAAAGFTKGAVFSNFASKQELLLEVARDDFGFVRDELLNEELTSAPWPLAAGTIADLIVSEIVNNGFIHCLVVEFGIEAARDPVLKEAYVTMRQRQRDEVASALGSRLTAQHGFPAAEIEEMLDGVIALTTGFVVERGVTDARLTPEVMKSMLLVQLRAQDGEASTES